MIAINGPFRRREYNIIDAGGRKLAVLAASARVPTEDVYRVGDLLAAAWDLRQLLRHVLTCSGSPDDCESCRAASELVAVEK